MGAPGEPEPEPENADDLFADGGPMHIGKEDDEGKEEYKLQLVGPTPERFIHLVTQMKFRIGEGAGEAIYQVGVQDDGTVRGITPEQLSASLATLERMAAELGADTSVIQERDGLEGRVAEVLVRTKPKPGGTTCDIRIAVAGNVDSGKSTLIGVMTGTGQLDNGNGAARSAVFTHRHEMESGRTSAVSQQIMGFSSTGRITNHSDLQRTLSWAEIVSQAAKVITFFDLAGHEKYLKTTVYGMTGNIPDYCMLLLGGNMGVTRMTKEHLGIAVNLALPAFVVVTKIDIAPPHVLEETIATISKILKSNGAGRKMPTIVQSMEDVVVAAKNVVHKRSVPIFLVSNVSGEGLAMLQTFLNLLPTRPHWEKKLNKPAQLQIDESFMITGIGTVVSGTMTAGMLCCVSRAGSCSLSPTHGTYARTSSIRRAGTHCVDVSVALLRRAHSSDGRGALRARLAGKLPEGGSQGHPQQTRRGRECAGRAVVLLRRQEDQALAGAEGHGADLAQGQPQGDVDVQRRDPHPLSLHDRPDQLPACRAHRHRAAGRAHYVHDRIGAAHRRASAMPLLLHVRRRCRRRRRRPDACTLGSISDA
jgi:GTPase